MSKGTPILRSPHSATVQDYNSSRLVVDDVTSSCRTCVSKVNETKMGCEEDHNVDDNGDHNGARCASSDSSKSLINCDESAHQNDLRRVSRCSTCVVSVVFILLLSAVSGFAVSTVIRLSSVESRLERLELLERQTRSDLNVLGGTSQVNFNIELPPTTDSGLLQV